jgi:hypothetical protein
VECRIGSFLLLFLVVADLCRLPIGLSVPQSTHISRAPLCMSPRRNWDSPNPSPASECSLALWTKRVGGGHSPAAKGLGESQFRRLEKKRSTLPTLWSVHRGK